MGGRLVLCGTLVAAVRAGWAGRRQGGATAPCSLPVLRDCRTGGVQRGRAEELLQG